VASCSVPAGIYSCWKARIPGAVHVSRIAFGAWQLGGEWGRFDENAAIAAIRRARDQGVNFFDTAHGGVLSQGAMEETASPRWSPPSRLVL
jgi:predicted oxidoreductase